MTSALMQAKLVSRRWEKLSKSQNLWQRLTLAFCQVAEEIWKTSLKRCKPRPIVWSSFYWEVLHDYNKIQSPLFNTTKGWGCLTDCVVSLELQIAGRRGLDARYKSMDFSQTTVDHYIGQYCLQGRGGQVPYSKRVITQFLVQHGQTVFLSAWVKAQYSNETCILMQCNDTISSHSPIKFHSGSGEWELLKTSLGPVSCIANCLVLLWNESDTHYAYFDHVFAGVSENSSPTSISVPT